MDAIASDITKATADEGDTPQTLYNISSMAVALRYILNTLEESCQQPLVSAIQLCLLIEEMAQEEANRISI